jgi:hypothetical protein
MKYRDMLGFPKKKEKKKVTPVIPEQPEPSVTELLKEEFGDTINEGPAYEYVKELKNISKLYDAYWNAVKDLGYTLTKKGLNKEARELFSTYQKKVTKFHHWFEKWVGKLM